MYENNILEIFLNGFCESMACFEVLKHGALYKEFFYILNVLKSKYGRNW